MMYMDQELRQLSLIKKKNERMINIVVTVEIKKKSQETKELDNYVITIKKRVKTAHFCQ